jgi:hypothetical protein
MRTLLHNRYTICTKIIISNFKRKNVGTYFCNYYTGQPNYNNNWSTKYYLAKKKNNCSRGIMILHRFSDVKIENLAQPFIVKSRKSLSRPYNFIDKFLFYTKAFLLSNNARTNRTLTFCKLNFNNCQLVRFP